MNAYLILGLTLVAAAVLFVLLPIVRPANRPTAFDSRRAEFEARRQELYRQILEIEFDQQVGKVDAADARTLCDRLLAQAAGLLAEQSTEKGAPEPEVEIEAEIEREVAALRRALRGSGDTVTELGATRP